MNKKGVSKAKSTRRTWPITKNSRFMKSRICSLFVVSTTSTTSNYFILTALVFNLNYIIKRCIKRIMRRREPKYSIIVAPLVAIKHDAAHINKS